jgi:ABC-type dipeptide/oligopeptide/nickel transport system permease component
MYDAIVGRDLYLVVGCALFGAMLLAVANVLADLLRGVVDPRVRLS